MERARIDWANLEPLPRRKRDCGATRDDLAARKFNMKKAKHKGRCHISNQKRRQIAREQSQSAAIRAEVRNQSYFLLKRQIAAYWRGELDEHP